MYHERMMYNSPYTSIPVGSGFGAAGNASMIAMARDAGRGDDPVARDLIGEAPCSPLPVRRSRSGSARG